jgi:hypothetical protein
MDMVANPKTRQCGSRLNTQNISCCVQGPAGNGWIWLQALRRGRQGVDPFPGDLGDKGNATDCRTSTVVHRGRSLKRKERTGVASDNFARNLRLDFPRNARGHKRRRRFEGDRTMDA